MSKVGVTELKVETSMWRPNVLKKNQSTPGIEPGFATTKYCPGLGETERNEGGREKPAEGDQLDNAISQLPLRSVVVAVVINIAVVVAAVVVREDVGVHVDVVDLVVNVASAVLAVLDQGHWISLPFAAVLNGADELGKTRNLNFLTRLFDDNTILATTLILIKRTSWAMSTKPKIAKSCLCTK